MASLAIGHFFDVLGLITMMPIANAPFDLKTKVVVEKITCT